VNEKERKRENDTETKTLTHRRCCPRALTRYNSRLVEYRSPISLEVRERRREDGTVSGPTCEKERLLSVVGKRWTPRCILRLMSFLVARLMITETLLPLFLSLSLPLFLFFSLARRCRCFAVPFQDLFARDFPRSNICWKRAAACTIFRLFSSLPFYLLPLLIFILN